MSGSTKTAITKSLRHLRPPTQGQHTPIPTKMLAKTKYVAPSDRIKYWNIVPGDEVRLTVGSEKEKGLVAKVESVNKETNTVFLEGITYLKHQVPRLVPSPDGGEPTMRPPREAIQRPIHYSNVQLKVPGLVDEKGDPVFASHLTTKRAGYNRKRKLHQWQRWASGRGIEGSVLVPWPEKPKSAARPFGEQEADKTVALQVTFKPFPRTKLACGLPPTTSTLSADDIETIRANTPAHLLPHIFNPSLPTPNLGQLPAAKHARVVRERQDRFLLDEGKDTATFELEQDYLDAGKGKSKGGVAVDDDAPLELFMERELTGQKARRAKQSLQM